MVGHCSREIPLFASIPPDLENNFSLNVTHITPYSIMHSAAPICEHIMYIEFHLLYTGDAASSQ